jgi:hypothetical protein
VLRELLGGRQFFGDFDVDFLLGHFSEQVIGEHFSTRSRGGGPVAGGSSSGSTECIAAECTGVSPQLRVLSRCSAGPAVCAGPRSFAHSVGKLQNAPDVSAHEGVERQL